MTDALTNSAMLGPHLEIQKGNKIWIFLKFKAWSKIDVQKRWVTTTLGLANVGHMVYVVNRCMDEKMGWSKTWFEVLLLAV
jgi:hypothetical protein